MMAVGTEKQTTSSSFSERMRNTLGNIFPFTMGGGAGNEGESQEEEDEEEQGDFESQVSLNSSTQENEAYVGKETGTMDKFGVVTTISKEANTPGQSKDFAIMTTSELQAEESRNRGLGNALADHEVDNEKTSRQRVKARISTSTKLPGTDRVTPPLVTPLVDNGAALEEALNNIVDSLGEQNEQMSIRMGPVHQGSSSGYATRGNGTWGPNSRTSSTGNRQTSNERPTQGTHATGKTDSGNRGHASPRRGHVGQAGNTHCDSDCRDAPHTEPLTRCKDTQAGHSRDATAMATAFEPLNRSLETFLTRLSRTNERSEKSRGVFKKQDAIKTNLMAVLIPG